ncbi:TetR/AcrR family transcriptional regulator [Jongsikchunia kroppenstedtii]|uniref:TetR/AcrR family transcriptional regulator n=1 Tax=Jongsikchunia kroppenstedtii TaxID=1121721 RepID=UPI00036F0FCB|nr:TetR/AcrR family transcriptional regulator [Jongsikchunia kroppenstedtii]
MAAHTGKLSQEAIVAAAIELADADGLDGLSMRKIADSLGVGAMSLYRHVADKDQLVGIMVEEVIGNFAYPPTLSGDWRADAHLAADIDWRMYQQHPWIMYALTNPRHNMGPESLRSLAWLMEVFAPVAATDAEAAQMAYILWNYVLGVSVNFITDNPEPDEPEAIWHELLAHEPSRVPEPIVNLVASGGIQTLIDADAMLRRGVDDLCHGFATRSAATR